MKYKSDDLKEELIKIKKDDAKILIYNIKMAYFDEIAKEINELGDKRIEILK